jgi:hypothetical protein
MMLRLALVAVLLAATAQARPGEFFSSCSVGGCYARCLEFALDSEAGLGLNADTVLYDGATVAELAKIDLSTVPRLTDFSTKGIFVSYCERCQKGAHHSFVPVRLRAKAVA